MSTTTERNPLAKGGPVLTGWSVGLALFAFTVVNGQTASTDAVQFAVGACILTGVLTWFLLRDGILPGAVIVLVLAFAYIPSSWDAIAVGFARTEMRTTSESLAWALVAFLAQLLLTAAAAWWGARTDLVRSIVRPGLRLLEPEGRDQSFIVGFMVLFVVTIAASVRDGQWTAYTPGGNASFDEMKLAGGFRVALLYANLIVGATALAGMKLVTATTRRGLMFWMAFSAIMVIVVFVVQSRRLMICSFALLVLPQLIRAESVLGRGMVRRVVVMAVGGIVLSALLYGSLAWRATLRNRSEDTMAHLQSMTETRVGADEAIDNLRGRLTYLWMDAVAVEMGERLSTPDLIIRAFWSQLAVTIPGALYPEKYKIDTIVCETMFSTKNDLPCTPFAEGMLFAGGIGVFCVAVCWAIAVAMAASLYAAGSASGYVLSGAMLFIMTTIETMAFPVLSCVRIVILLAGFLAPLAWLWQAVEGIWSRTHPDANAGLTDDLH